MAQAFTVRRVGPKDEASLQGLLLREAIQAGWTQEELNTLTDRLFHPERVADIVIANARKPDTTIAAWIACVDGDDVGVITTKNVNGGIYVDPSYRQLGLAQALIEARNDFQRSLGAQSVEAHIEASNGPSLNLHRKMGYVFNEASQAAIAQGQQRGISVQDLLNEKGAPLLLVLTKTL